MTSFRPYEPDQQLLLPPSLRQFSLRGLRKVSGEFNLVCMAMNLRRMATMIRWT